VLRDLVQTARKALKDEDDFLRSQIGQNVAVYSGQRAGLLRPGFDDERYYQRLLARQILNWPYEVFLESNRHDLILMHPNTDDRFVVVEMKRWMDKLGNTAPILDDLGRLRVAQPAPQHRIMLIFSANPSRDTANVIDDLLLTLNKAVGLSLTRGLSFEEDSFPTNSDYFEVRNDPMDFWVGGIELLS
jgi:hypothetical protein